MLVILRDQSLPLPAGAILLSPWVDLSHSFPSIAGDNSNDYIPSHGFMQRPSASWPPPTAQDMEEIATSAVKSVVDEGLPRKSTHKDRKRAEDEAVQGFAVMHGQTDGTGDQMPGTTHELSVNLGGKTVVIKDQIQMYTTNQLIKHPLVSSILQPSLGGLPPLLIMTGGGEVLRDEQIYLAHKAANPAKHPPSDAILEEIGGKDIVSKWKPTDVQLQIWDDLCHVAPTLSFTRPAKFMYRSIAQFGAWALAKAQKTDIEILDDDDVSIISGSSDKDMDLEKPSQSKISATNGAVQGSPMAGDKIGKAGEALPPFKHHMIRQRVDRNGNVFPLDPASSLPAMQLPPSEIGTPKAGPLRKWLNAKKQWDRKYAREKRHVQKQRAKEMAQGYQGFGDDEVPPPSALAGRRGFSMPKQGKMKRSWGMSMWSAWGGKHDESTMKREEKADRQLETTTVAAEGSGTAKAQASKTRKPALSSSRRRTISYAGQDDDVGENTPPVVIARKKEQAVAAEVPLPVIKADDQLGLPEPQYRPSAGGKAFPFKLRPEWRADGRNASTITLMSERVATPKGDEEGKQLGAAPIHRREENVEGGKGEGRRMTLEDQEGVLHKGLPQPNLEEKKKDIGSTQTGLSQPSTAKCSEAVPQHKKEKAIASDNGDQIDTRDSIKEGRRMTIPDDDGVLHKGSPSNLERNIEQPGLGSSANSDDAQPTEPISAQLDGDKPNGVTSNHRRRTLEGNDGVLHKGLSTPIPSESEKHTESVRATTNRTTETPAHGSEDDVRGVSHEQRRLTLEGGDSVFHKGQPQAIHDVGSGRQQKGVETVTKDCTWSTAADDASEASDDTMKGSSGEARRMIAQGEDGILHKGAPEAETPRRPQVERFETAKEDI